MPDVIVAIPVLAVAVAVGLVAHEGAHAVMLEFAGVEYDLEFAPTSSEGVVAALASTPWARVRPRPTGEEPPWLLRLAALMPLSLAVPVLALGVVGWLPGADDPVATAALLGWLGCALPSPQDFSVAFYAHRLLEDANFDAAGD